MSGGYYERLLNRVYSLTRLTLGQMMRIGTVHEVKDDKMRIKLGQDDKGQPVLSPWLHSSNMRGGARERRFYKKDQTVMILSPTGDMRQGMVLPYAINKDFLSPDHANKTGQDEEVYQLDDLRIKATKDGYDIWLQPPKKKQQQQSELQKMPDREDDSSGQASMKVRINKNGGITGRVGKNRFMAHSKGAKIKAGKDFAAITPGKLIVSREWEIGSDPIPDDDK